jgi:hypothetical protein
MPLIIPIATAVSGGLTMAAAAVSGVVTMAAAVSGGLTMAAAGATAATAAVMQDNTKKAQKSAEQTSKDIAAKQISAQTNAVNDQLAAQKMEAEAQRKLTEKAAVVSEQKSQIETLANLINAKQYYQTVQSKPAYTTPIEKTPENIFDQLNNFFDKIFRG